MSDPGFLAVRHPDLGPYQANPVPDPTALPCIQALWLQGSVWSIDDSSPELDLSGMVVAERYGSSLFSMNGSRVTTLVDSYVSVIATVRMPTADPPVELRVLDTAGFLDIAGARSESGDGTPTISLEHRFPSPAGNQIYLLADRALSDKVNVSLGVSGWPQSICAGQHLCPDLVSNSYPLSSTTDLGYCFDGTYWYGVNNDGIVRYNYPSFSGATPIYYPANGSGYPTLDFAGHLYLLEYRGFPYPVDVVKLNLSDLSTTVLATLEYPGDAWGLLYHPTTGMLYCLAYGSDGAEHDYLLSIDPSSGAVSTLVDLTIGSSTPGFRDAEPMTSSPNYLWGRGYTSSPENGLNVWHYNVHTGVFAEGFHTSTGTGAVRGAGVGSAADAYLVDLNISGRQPVSIDSGFVSTPWACGPIGTGPGASYGGWSHVAWVDSTSVYEQAQ